MDKPKTPHQWAFQITHILNAALGDEHFPVNIELVAKEISSQLFSDEPITIIQGTNLPGFDGALYKSSKGNKGWGIFFNNSFASKGRINFTLAHEFGHYLLHRLKYPEGIQCSERDLTRWESEFGQIEYQANIFAANLLMPLDDYRKQISPDSILNMDMMDFITERYQVSLLAALLRWIEFTEKRAVLVVSRDGYILWAKSSKPAFKSGIYFRTANVPPVEIPALSIAARKHQFDDNAARQGISHDAGIWFNEPAKEITVFAEQYDFTISILQMGSAGGYQLSIDERMYDN